MKHSTDTGSCPSQDKAERSTRVERAMRNHFGFDCGEAYRIDHGLYAVGPKGTRYECIHVNTASNADLLNGIDAGDGYLLLRCKDQLAALAQKEGK